MQGALDAVCDSTEHDQENFYSPLCMSGYLTPLQRKKLREKRNFELSEYQLPEVHLKKRKKALCKVRKKQQFLITRKEKTKVPHFRCAVSKIVHNVPDRNLKDKKFFKTCSSNRLEKANFTFSLKMDFCIKNDSGVKEVRSYREKICLSEKNFNQNEPDFGSDKPLKNVKPSISDNPDLVSNTCSNIMSTPLSEMESTNETSLFENSVFDLKLPSDEMLLKRQEKARIIARKKMKESNFLVEQEIEKNSESRSEKLKLYPIFYVSKKIKDSPEIKRNSKNVTKCIRDSSKGGEQMILDAGQKDIGVKHCDVCDMIFTIGQEEDEKLHSVYHNKYLTNLKFPGWKEENVIGEYQDGRVLMVRKDDKSLKLKKIEDVLEIANRDLGFPSAGFPTKPDVTFILFILNDKRIVGCVVAERIFSACRVMLASSSPTSCSSNSQEKVWRIGNWYSSTESVPAVCGINRIWVARDFRLQKVASRMVDCLRCHFIHGHVIGIDELAFTDPSTDGREFAASYTGSNHFLVYK